MAQTEGRKRPHSASWAAAAWRAAGYGAAEADRALGEQEPRPLLLEHPVARGGALGGVREQRGGQVVPGDLRDDRVDPAVVGRGQQRDPAAVGRAGDADPWVAGAVEPHPGLLGQPADQLLGVLDLIVRRVQRDLAGGGAEPAG